MFILSFTGGQLWGDSWPLPGLLLHLPLGLWSPALGNPWIFMQICRYQPGNVHLKMLPKHVLRELILNLSSQGEERLKVDPITGFARNPVTILFFFPTLSRFSKNIKDKQILKSLFFQIAKEIIH